MRAVTIARTPFSEVNLAYNVMMHGVGGIHINNTRLWRGPWPEGCLEAPGKWPANVILMHLPECKYEGFTIEHGTINRWSDGAKPFGDGAGHHYQTNDTVSMVESWECAIGCPARQTNQQCPDSSKFFKQVQDIKGLIEYLVVMAKLDDEANILVEMDLDVVDWGSLESCSVSGLITEGNPEAHTDEMMRVLKPGAHVMLLSPESEPTGHTGACALDDSGFEIRDTYLVVDTLEFHYVAKPGATEKNLGVQKREKEVEEEFATLKDPSEDLSSYKLSKKVQRELSDGKTVQLKKIPQDMEDLVRIEKVSSTKEVQNDHPTVKPKKIFEVLFEDIPEGAMIVDPFVGSGSSGLAALSSGHDFFGVDLSAEHIQIATERIHYGINVDAPWKGIQLTSDVEIEEPETEDLDLEDLFG